MTTEFPIVVVTIVALALTSIFTIRLTEREFALANKTPTPEAEARKVPVEVGPYYDLVHAARLARSAISSEATVYGQGLTVRREMLVRSREIAVRALQRLEHEGVSLEVEPGIRTFISAVSLLAPAVASSERMPESTTETVLRAAERIEQLALNRLQRLASREAAP